MAIELKQNRKTGKEKEDFFDKKLKHNGIEIKIKITKLNEKNFKQNLMQSPSITPKTCCANIHLN